MKRVSQLNNGYIYRSADNYMNIIKIFRIPNATQMYGFIQIFSNTFKKFCDKINLSVSVKRIIPSRSLFLSSSNEKQIHYDII